MPWHIEYGNAECGDDQWSVVQDDNGKVMGCHDTRADAISQQQALYAAEPEAAASLTAAADAEPTGGMVAFLPSEDDAARLALDGYEAADQLHMTSMYLGDANTYDAAARMKLVAKVAAALAGMPAFSADAFAVSAFNPGGDSPCLVLGMSGHDLAHAQMALDGIGEHDAQHHPWVPHITLAYDPEPESMMGDDMRKRLGPVKFDRVRIAFGDQVVDLPLDETQVEQEPADDTAEGGDGGTYEGETDAETFHLPGKHNQKDHGNVTSKSPIGRQPIGTVRRGPAFEGEAEAETFHLPGKHNQKDHGRSAGPKIDRSHIGGPARSQRGINRAVDDAETFAEDEPVAASAFEDEQALIAAMVTGTRFEGVAAIEGEVFGDNRRFEPNALTWIDPPFALKAQFVEEPEHNGSVIVGRVDEITREGNLIRVAGVFDDAGVNGAEALRLARGMFLNQVSVCADDLDNTDVELIWPELPPLPMPLPEEPPAGEEVQADLTDSPIVPDGDAGMESVGPDGTQIVINVEAPEEIEPVSAIPMVPTDEIGRPLVKGPAEPIENYHAGRIRSITMVAEAACPECQIMVVDEPAPAPTRVEVMTAAADGGWTITIPELWPEAWFEEPEPQDMPDFGGLRITASGRITGYLAPPTTVHRAFRSSGRPVTVPLGQDYSEFNNKAALVASRDGGVAKINAGAITFNCGHVDLSDPVRSFGNAAVREVYDNSCSVFARVRIWESKRYPGAPIVAGALLHGVDADAIERAMACHLSGDWQGGKLSAALLVPVEGFPPRVQGMVRVTEQGITASAVPIRFERRPAEIYAALERSVTRLEYDRLAKLAKGGD